MQTAATLHAAIQTIHCDIIPGQVDEDHGDVVGGALVDGGAREHAGSDLGGGVTRGAALLRPPQAPLRQRARLLRLPAQRDISTVFAKPRVAPAIR